MIWCDNLGYTHDGRGDGPMHGDTKSGGLGDWSRPQIYSTGYTHTYVRCNRAYKWLPLGPSYGWPQRFAGSPSNDGLNLMQKTW